MEVVISILMIGLILRGIYFLWERFLTHRSVKELMAYSLLLKEGKTIEKTEPNATKTPLACDHGVSNSSDFFYKTYEEWFDVFRRTAGEENPIIKTEVSEDGTIWLFDLLDHTPCQRAFLDRVDPVRLAKTFAKQFDVTKALL